MPLSSRSDGSRLEGQSRVIARTGMERVVREPRSIGGRPTGMIDCKCIGHMRPSTLLAMIRMSAADRTRHQRGGRVESRCHILTALFVPASHRARAVTVVTRHPTARPPRRRKGTYVRHLVQGVVDRDLRLCARALPGRRAEPSIGCIAQLTDQSCRRIRANPAARRVVETSSP